MVGKNPFDSRDYRLVNRQLVRLKSRKFADFNSMLKSMKWSREFWDEYKRLKGDLPSAEQMRKDEDDWAAYEESMQKSSGVVQDDPEGRSLLK